MIDCDRDLFRVRLPVAAPGPAALASRPPAVRSRRTRAPGTGQGPARADPWGGRPPGVAERLKERHKYNQVLRSSGHDVFL